MCGHGVASELSCNRQVRNTVSITAVVLYSCCSLVFFSGVLESSF